MLTRRDALKTIGAAAASVAAAPLVNAQLTTAPATAGFLLPPLGYAYDALEPFIDAQTMQIHHDKHHAAYVANLNAALSPEQLSSKNLNLDDVLKQAQAMKPDDPKRAALLNNGGGHYNHSLFWTSLKKNENGKPVGELAAAIDKELAGFDAMKKALSTAAAGVFGSGWAWLALKEGKLQIIQLHNQETALLAGVSPLLGIDVWEHAYYLKYQNKRPDYVAAFFNVVDWDTINERYKKAVKG